MTSFCVWYLHICRHTIFKLISFKMTKMLYKIIDILFAILQSYIIHFSLEDVFRKVLELQGCGSKRKTYH